MKDDTLARLTLLGVALLGASAAHAERDEHGWYDRWHRPDHARNRPASIELGPRPQFLVNDMADGPLKRELVACSSAGTRKTTSTPRRTS
jgi:glycerophosphoryl diester phosphodiesterase